MARPRAEHRPGRESDKKPRHAGSISVRFAFLPVDLALEEQNWSRHIFDPLTPRINIPLQRRGADSKSRLHEAIRRLNMGQRPPKIRFRGDGTGEGLTWEWIE